MARKPKTLLELNTILAAGSFMTTEEREAGRRLPLMRQARLMVKAMPLATRVGEFISMWAIAKYQEGAVTVDGVAEFWDEPPRTMYRRLAEFRDVWGPVGYDSPDVLADSLIADFRRRRETLQSNHLVRLLTVEVPVPPGAVLGAMGS